MPRVSVCLPTWRLGGLDLTRWGLDRQTFHDFELVIVDSLWDRRRQAVHDLFTGAAYPVRHLPSARDGVDPFVCHAHAAHNEALVQASGEIVLWICDWTVLDPRGIERHLEVLDRWGPLTYVLGGYGVVSIQPRAVWIEYAELKDHQARVDRGEVPIEESGRAFEDLVGRLPEGSPVWVQSTRWMPIELVLPVLDRSWSGSCCRYDDPMPAGWVRGIGVHLKNESVRRSILIDVGGLEEELDGGHLYGDTDLGIRLGRMGMRFRYEPDLLAVIVDSRPFLRNLRLARAPEENRPLLEETRDGDRVLPRRGLST